MLSFLYLSQKHSVDEIMQVEASYDYKSDLLNKA